MKRVITFVFAFLFAASLGLMAQEPQAKDQSAQKAENKEVKSAQKGKSMSLTGWVKDQDGKTVFINDKDKQAWSISNMDAVKGHEGHHVKVKAMLNADDHSMNVEKLTMLRKAKQTGEEQKAEDKK
ncbi:MAG TPA: hypothetical protein VFT65_17965 [Candidatus Angelobacter sp.]|nr:hypothetical protein [Candidatus Angelobacter sp.]